MQILNETPYKAETVCSMDRCGAELLIVAVKGTWIFASGDLRLAEVQAPLVKADQYHGKPGKTSMVQEFELAPPKPSTNVVLLGHARAPRSGICQFEVLLHAGPIRKMVRVTGRRRWWSLFGLPRMTRPEPVEAVPLIWENSFGGTDAEGKRWEPQNPVGRGFKTGGSGLTWKGTEVPNLEDPRRPVRNPGLRGVPWNVGHMAPFWEPRRSRAGTYDAKWIEERAPLLPEDFDESFYHTVPDDQVAPRRFTGGEPIEVMNAGPARLLRCGIPRQFPVGFVRFDNDLAALPLLLDTVAIDADTLELRLLWKGVLPVHRRLHGVREIRVAIAASRREGP